MSGIHRTLWGLGIAALAAAGAVAAPPESTVAPVITIGFDDIYQLKGPDLTNVLSGRLFDRHNVARLSLAEAALEKRLSDSIRLRGVFGAGDIANLLTGYDGGRGEGRYRNILELYGDYTPAGGNTHVRLGKYLSPFGIERPQPWKNDFLSHSNLYRELPKYHFGVQVGYELPSLAGLEVVGGAVNALFNTANTGVNSNGGGLDSYFGARYRFGDPMGAHGVGSVLYGNGTDVAAEPDIRSKLWDASLQYWLPSGLKVGAEYMTGDYKVLGQDRPTAYLVSLGKGFSFGEAHLRYDYFRNRAYNDSVTWSNAWTVNLDRPICDNAFLRTEFRHDSSNQAIYLGGPGNPNRKSQDTIGLGVFYTTDSFGKDSDVAPLFTGAERFTISGGFSSYYQLGARKANGNRIESRLYDFRQGIPTLNLAELNVGLPGKVGGVGFQSTWIAGDTAERMHRSDGADARDGEGRYTSIGQLYATYGLSRGEVRLGKFFSPFPSQQPEVWKNDFFSNNLTSYFLPQYHLGVGVDRLDVGVKGLGITGYAVNALFNSDREGVNDSNDDKDWIVGFDYRSNTDAMPVPGEWRLRSTFGGGKSSGESFTSLNDTQVEYRLDEDRVVKLESATATGRSGGDRTRLTSWSASLNQPLGVGTLRGRIEGAEAKFGIGSSRLNSYTLGYEAPICKPFTLRTELRHDRSNQAQFAGDRKDQTTLTFGTFYTFGK